MASDELLDKAASYAFARLKEVGDHVLKLPMPLQTVVIVYTAQGIIDNGGFQYFFENDFPNNPQYSTFSEAYRRIGASEAADSLDAGVAMFPFPDPHKSAAKRKAYIDSQSSGSSSQFFRLGDRICGDESVWDKLARYVADNRSFFEAV